MSQSASQCEPTTCSHATEYGSFGRALQSAHCRISYTNVPYAITKVATTTIAPIVPIAERCQYEWKASDIPMSGAYLREGAFEVGELRGESESCAEELRAAHANRSSCVAADLTIERLRQMSAWSRSTRHTWYVRSSASAPACCSHTRWHAGWSSPAKPSTPPR